MGLATQNPLPDENGRSGPETPEPKSQPKPSDAKPARGAPGSFDQPEPRADVMPREGGPHPEQTAEVPKGLHGRSAPPGSRGHNSAPVVRKPDDQRDD